MYNKSAPKPHLRLELGLDAAVAVFGNDGLGGSTMDDIAARSGLPKPTLYRTFGSKEDLFAAAVERECTRLIDYLFAEYDADEGLTVGSRLRAGLHAFFDYAEQHADGFRLLFLTSHHKSSAVAEAVHRTRRRIVERVAEMTAAEMKAGGLPSGPVAEVFAAMLVGVGEHTARCCAEDPTWDRTTVLDLAASFVTAGAFGVDRVAVERADRAIRRRRRK